MRKSIYLLLTFFGLALGLTSCFKDKETDFSGYNKCAITAISLKDLE